jgi:hypothetical protein
MSVSVHSLDEVAQQLGKSPRWLRKWLRDHPRDQEGRPLFGAAGRTMVFSDRHVERLLEALPCPSKSSPPATRKRETYMSGGTISESLLTKAAALTGDPSLAPSSSGLSRPSSEANTRRVNLRLVLMSQRS